MDHSLSTCRSKLAWTWRDYTARRRTSLLWSTTGGTTPMWAPRLGIATRSRLVLRSGAAHYLQAAMPSSARASGYHRAPPPRGHLELQRPTNTSDSPLLSSAPQEVEAVPTPSKAGVAGSGHRATESGEGHSKSTGSKPQPERAKHPPSGKHLLAAVRRALVECQGR